MSREGLKIDDGFYLGAWAARPREWEQQQRPRQNIRLIAPRGRAANAPRGSHAAG